jgi:hypothetical protein
VCVCTCLSVFTCALVDLFCPPLTTTTTVLPIPHSVCPSSPHFVKCCVFWKCVWKCPQDGECGSRVGKKHSTSALPPCHNHPFPLHDHARFVFGRFRRRKAEFRPHEHALACETSSGRPQCDSYVRVAYFDTSRDVPAYSQCPRSTEDSRCVSRYLQCPCALTFSYFHILRPQNVRKKRHTQVSPNLGPKACLQMIM